MKNKNIIILLICSLSLNIFILYLTLNNIRKIEKFEQKNENQQIKMPFIKEIKELCSNHIVLIKNNNLSRAYEDFTKKFKKTYNQEIYIKTAKNIQEKLGTFKNYNFYGIELKTDNSAPYYKVNYIISATKFDSNLELKVIRISGKLFLFSEFFSSEGL